MGVGRILVIDDELTVRSSLRRFFEAHGFEVNEAESATSAETEFQRCPPDLALLDYTLADANGLDLMPVLKRIDNVPIIMLTGHGSIDLAVRALRSGAEHFIEKPIVMTALLAIVQRILVETYRGRDDDLDLTLDELERRHILRVMDRVGGSVDLAAAKLGISRSSLYQRLKRFRPSD